MDRKDKPKVTLAIHMPLRFPVDLFLSSILLSSPLRSPPAKGRKLKPKTEDEVVADEPSSGIPDECINHEG